MWLSGLSEVATRVVEFQLACVRAAGPIALAIGIGVAAVVIVAVVRMVVSHR